MEKKFALIVLKKRKEIFTTSIQNVKTVILKEVQNVTMRIKIIYQINEKIFMKKNRAKLLQNQNERYII